MDCPRRTTDSPYWKWWCPITGFQRVYLVAPSLDLDTDEFVPLWGYRIFSALHSSQDRRMSLWVFHYRCASKENRVTRFEGV
jgi:hypothetical protein